MVELPVVTLRASACLICVALVSVGSVFEMTGAQQTATALRNATLDPNEARAINTIFNRWGITSRHGWNISGELCSGTAIDDTLLDFSPGIKCDCSFNGGTTCHVIALMVYATSDSNSFAKGVGLPNELWSLTYLTSLNLSQIYLTGSIPSAIANLTRMQYLGLGINALSGVLPREIGQLTDLRSLQFGINNFTGPLPPEIGNCTKLEVIMFDSSGISGPIPSTFARLQNLRILFGSDNELVGRIPTFIGNLTRLTTLNFEGTSLQGPIPSSFSNLTSLTDLRISDMSNGDSSLDFLSNMASLTTLILRNNNISGSIPSNFDQYQSLTLLDLSFNNFSGRIPDSLFNTPSLVHLFLGNNRLTGSLPAHKSPVLQFIDLSYNELSGSFPSWINQQHLQLNLVANNFTIQDSNSSALPFGLNCLQRNFPCSRGQPQYSSFAINCGGPQVRSAARIVYEADNDENLGPATYYVTSERRWAVSNVGLPSRNSDHVYSTSTMSTVLTSDLELYQRARISAGSLRYYGLGLENRNYTASLQFAEISIGNGLASQGRGRRVFNIYIQGNLAFRDFDIRREAGESFSAVVREFNASVRENYLEIHLIWAGKGSCCFPSPGTYGPSISAISVTPTDFIPVHTNNRTGLIVGIAVSVAAISFLSLFSGYYFIRRKRQATYEDEDFLGIEAKPYAFSYAELKAATQNFSADNKLGEGGFGPVYKGKLDDGRMVAVKQLSLSSHQGKSQFVAEIVTVSAVQHRNLVKLYGFCSEGDNRLLVYEYLENKSLDQALFGKGNRVFLDWAIRFEICLAVAKGLAYLHEESRLRIIHRDVKASNILLDSQLNPKISDFGLAKLYDDSKTHINTRVAGTIGYLAPEYAMRGHLTEKADVFSFGVVTLEIVSGKANRDPNQNEDEMYLLDWAWHCHENKRCLDLVDKNLTEINEGEVRKVIGVALLCTQASPGLRPSMSHVVAMLCGDADIPVVTMKPGYLTEWIVNDTDAFATDGEITTSGTGSRCFGPSPSNAEETTPSYYSPISPSKPILLDSVGDRR